MLALFTNWKTTLAGAGTILAALADITTSASHGAVSPNLATDLTGILVGLGLVAAKDASSTTTTSVGPSVTTVTK